jgi:predicted lactoylglutathione lyase
VPDIGFGAFLHFSGERVGEIIIKEYIVYIVLTDQIFAQNVTGEAVQERIESKGRIRALLPSAGVWILCLISF